MSDTLTPEERALIDAFPKKRIKRIPTGVCGEYLGPKTRRQMLEQWKRTSKRNLRFHNAREKERRGKT